MPLVTEFTRPNVGSTPGVKVGVVGSNVIHVDPKSIGFGAQNTVITFVDGSTVEVADDYPVVVAALNV